jgi:tetratricopeptide (TPR) repeat protein
MRIIHKNTRITLLIALLAMLPSIQAQDNHKKDTVNIVELKAAAAGGDVKAQLRLGILYSTGEGVDKDLVESYRWLHVAVEHGNSQALMPRYEVGTKLTGEQIQEAKLRASGPLGKDAVEHMVHVYLDAAAAKQARGDLEGAIADFSKAIQFKPDAAVAYNNRGLAKQKKGDLNGAIEDYTKAIELEPDNAVVINNRSYAKKAAGDLNGANADHTKAVKLKADQEDAYLLRMAADPGTRKVKIRLKDGKILWGDNPMILASYDSSGNVAGRGGGLSLSANLNKVLLDLSEAGREKVSLGVQLENGNPRINVELSPNVGDQVYIDPMGVVYSREVVSLPEGGPFIEVIVPPSWYRAVGGEGVSVSAFAGQPLKAREVFGNNWIIEAVPKEPLSLEVVGKSGRMSVTLFPQFRSATPGDVMYIPTEQN